MQKNLELATISFRSEVASKHMEERSRSVKNRLKKGRFDEIVKQIHILRNIPKEVTIERDAIERRAQRKNLITCSINGGRESLLAPYDDHFVDMIIKLSRCWHQISTHEGMELINSLIKDIPIYEKDREQKIKNSYVKTLLVSMVLQDMATGGTSKDVIVIVLSLRKVKSSSLIEKIGARTETLT